MARIYWQRATTDNRGVSRSRGSLTFEQVKPTDGDDRGNRVFHYYQMNGQWHRQELVRTPHLYADRIMDVYRQITGQPEANRFLLHSRQHGHGRSVASIDSQAALEAQLRQGPWPKIIQVENNILYGEVPDGKAHPHVVVALGYRDGQVMIDNSHDPAWDRINQGHTISTAQLYRAMLPFGEGKR